MFLKSGSDHTEQPEIKPPISSHMYRRMAVSNRPPVRQEHQDTLPTGDLAAVGRQDTGLKSKDGVIFSQAEEPAIPRLSDRRGRMENCASLHLHPVFLPILGILATGRIEYLVTCPRFRLFNVISFSIGPRMNVLYPALFLCF